MKINYLRLKGFKGISRGMGLKELELDFINLPNGIIAFVGDNGVGKSTVLNNMHPYRTVPCRDKFRNLYEICEGTDAEKEIIFEKDGSLFRSLFLINAKSKKMESYLYKKEGSDWVVFSECQYGKNEAYDNAIENLVGSRDIYFLSAHRSQHAPPLFTKTKNELKQVFEDLLGLEDIREQGLKANEIKKFLLGKREALEGEISALKANIKVLQGKETRGKEIDEKIGALEKELASKTDEMTSIDASLKDAEIELSKQSSISATIARLTAEINTAKQKESTLRKSLDEEKAAYAKKLNDKNLRLERANKIASNGETIRQKIEEEKSFKNRLASIKADIEKADREKTSLQDDLSGIQKSKTRKLELQKELDQLNFKKQSSIEKAESELKSAEKEASKLDGLPCVNTDMPAGCRFVRDAVVAREKISELTALLEQQKAAVDPRTTQILDEIAGLNPVISGEVTLKENLNGVNNFVSNLKKEAESIESTLKEIERYTKLLPDLEISEQTIAQLKDEIESIVEEESRRTAYMESEIAGLAEEISSKTKQLDSEKLFYNPTLGGTIEELKKKKASIQSGCEGIRTQLNKLYTEKGGILEALKALQEQMEKLQEIERKAEDLNRDISEWAILEKAFGRDGLIALEIDDAGPSISAIANDLLRIYYGGRFSVKIVTTEPKKDNSGEMKEVFDIQVIDSAFGEEKSFIDLSGGQEVWVDDSITKAIAIHNSRTKGTEVKTLCTDEKDGALSISAKKEYFDVKRQALVLGGYEQEFFITHSPELQSKADARLVFAKGGVSVN